LSGRALLLIVFLLYIQAFFNILKTDKTLAGFLKKILCFHILPLCIAFVICYVLMKRVAVDHPVKSSFTAGSLNSLHNFDKFYPNDITHEMALAVALKKRVPVLFGSSELTSHHLNGIAYRFFCRENSDDKFLAVGHAGFQCFAMLTTLAANKALLRDSKITIILSPGWFEKQYASGTSLSSFFEFCPPDYLYQIYKDTTIDSQTKAHIERYIYDRYDKISKPDAVLRAMGKKRETPLNAVFNYPFQKADDVEITLQEQQDFYLTAQHRIVEQLSHTSAAPYTFENRSIYWDSLFKEAKKHFELISNNNGIGVENSYYKNWLKGKPKKNVEAVDLKNNQEYKDFEALIHFLKENRIKPLFVIMPLNPLAHQNLDVLNPTIHELAFSLKMNGFTTLNMFDQNSSSYEKGVLEDIMHPYDLGWYQIDRFILYHYHD
jgi:D-alanyl-lipoteichoic acid biosynthesis protein DltD